MRVEEIRYDLTSEISKLDMESQIGLLDLALEWAERNRQELDRQLDIGTCDDLDQIRELRFAMSPASFPEPEPVFALAQTMRVKRT